jgi:hypothetical protein
MGILEGIEWIPQSGWAGGGGGESAAPEAPAAEEDPFGKFDR